MSHVRVVALCEELHDSRDLGVVSEQDESERGDGGSSNVVIDIGHGDMEQLSDRLVVPRLIANVDCIFIGSVLPHERKLKRTSPTNVLGRSWGAVYTAP